MRFCVLLLLITGPVSHATVSNTVFLAGESVRVPQPNLAGHRWQVLDDQRVTVASGLFTTEDNMIDVGKLGTGWYRVEFLDEDDAPLAFTAAAVLSPLKTPPPPDSPLALDVALSWAPEEDTEVWRHCLRLATLAGAVMVRDRLRWRDIQPTRLPMPETTKYDKAAALQTEFGLQTLQVFHDTPAHVWAQDSDRGRVPADLRDTWRFCRDMATRFRDTVHVWQAWNEGNAPNFGGHAIDELCSHQKAAYWGFRAGNPEAVVSWAPLGGVNSEGLCRGIIENGTAAYFDVYALHSYDWPHDYGRLRQHAIAAAAGKPLWVTESDRGMAADPASPHGDFTFEDERRKARFMGQSIASSLAAGANRHFHFILPQYMEQEKTIQFGLLRHNYTPRMTYVALAAAGRFLAGARYLGRVNQQEDEEDVYVYAFRAQPDGTTRDVLVAWTETRGSWAERGGAVATMRLPAGLQVERVWDYLGRDVGVEWPTEITSAPVFIIMPKGEAGKLTVQPPPSTPPATAQAGRPSPVVLQLDAPGGTLVYRLNNWAPEHDRTMNAGIHELVVAAYHFGDAPVAGSIAINAPGEGWRCEPATWPVALEPMERHEQHVRLHIPEPGPPEEDGAWVLFQGDFGEAGAPRLAFRIMPHVDT